MRLVTFAGSDGNPRPGALLNNTVVDLSSRFRSIHSLVLGGEEAIRTAEDLAQSASSRFSLDEVRLLAPIPDPPRIFCIGLNYRDHAVESRMEVPKVPTVFLKLPTALVGHGEAIRLPSISSQPDYEVEFACVIGRDGHRIARENWLDYVFGYTILNDVSARDVQLATSQWVLGKSFPTFAPLGPAIVTKDEIPDPHALDIRLSIDGELLQHSNCAPASGRHHQHRHSSRRGPGPHPAALAEAWRDGYVRSCRIGTTGESCSGRRIISTNGDHAHLVSSSTANRWPID
jgi:2-keto-4-pentenoate hydratase/2-oxohepta-3-ene-1,7-dioic acid hydratase in catechol pathway